MFPAIPNPNVATDAAAPRFGEKDILRRSASTVTPLWSALCTWPR